MVEEVEIEVKVDVVKTLLEKEVYRLILLSRVLSLDRCFPPGLSRWCCITEIWAIIKLHERAQ